MCPGRTRAIINTSETPTGSFAQQPNWQFPQNAVQALIKESVDNNVDFIDASKLATALMGDSIATNLFMLGFAYQKGALPVSDTAILHAVELNGVAIEANKKSFLWGRRAAVDLARVIKIAQPAQPLALQLPDSLDKIIERRVELLTQYQNRSYAQQYRDIVMRIKHAEDPLKRGHKFTLAVAKYAFKLMAYKDEYEVARLYTHGDFTQKLQAQFEGDFRIKFNLAPPLFAKKDSAGHPIKTQYGTWMWHAFKLLAKFKVLRGTKFDPFGYTEERRCERQLAKHYQDLMLELAAGLTIENLDTAIALANLPEQVRGYGHIKEQTIRHYYQQVTELTRRNQGLASAA